MKTRRLGVIGGCEARTQCRVRSWRLRTRPRTTHRAAERGQAMECFVSLGAQKNPPAGLSHSTVPNAQKTHAGVPKPCQSRAQTIACSERRTLRCRRSPQSSFQLTTSRARSGGGALHLKRAPRPAGREQSRERSVRRRVARETPDCGNQACHADARSRSRLPPCTWVAARAWP